MVIAAHGASIALGQAVDVLRVLVTASEATRIARVRKQRLLPDDREATRGIRESDRARLAYLRDFYGITEETPTHYDLVINTDTLGEEAAIAIIVAAART